MTIMTAPNAEIVEAMKENEVFWEFLEFGVEASLMGYFDALFSKTFLAK